MKTWIVGRVWDEGFSSETGGEICVLLLLTTPFEICYLRIATPASMFIVGDEITWKGQTVFWKSKLLEQDVETLRLGHSFAHYDTMKAFMTSEWKD